MNILLVILIGGVLLLLATRSYPFWIAKIFGQDDTRPTPARELDDGQDYVPTKTPVVFAHHFASIAGAGPIVGPIIALVYGWGPAWLWIIIGGIFYGAVHDMTAMFVSLREGGKTIAEIARRELGRSGYLLFVAFLLLVLSLVNAIFLKLSAAALTSAYPLDKLGLDPAQTLFNTDDKGKAIIGGIATTSVIIMTVIAPIIGLMIHRWRAPTPLVFIIAAAACILSVITGFYMPVTLAPDTWMIILAAYAFFACWIPVWLIIQPRDFMNVQILYGGLALLLLGAMVAGFSSTGTMQTPIESIDTGVEKMGPIWPIMFITIACGAISGFHSLVASGTTVKQLSRESDCRRVGYNAMILESFLALLVLVAVGSQMNAAEYAANMDPAQDGSAILTFAVGCGGLFTHLGIPMSIGCVLGILIIEGFLVTTLDTAIRLGRYLFEELWAALAGAHDDPARLHPILRSPLFNTGCAVAMMLLFAYSDKAAASLWPYFGAGNQLIGALALTTVALWLIHRGRRYLFALIPAVFMVFTAIYALGYLVIDELNDTENKLRAVIVGAGILLLILSGGFVLIATGRIVSAIKRGVD